METGKQGFVNISALGSSVSAEKEASMHVQAPLTTMLVHTMPVLPPHPQAQTHPQAHLAAASQEPANLQLAVPPLYAKETLPFLTLHFPGGLQLHQGPSPGTTTSAARHKSAGKHLCSHCGRDCLKPSVLEKHLRCHTGERPYPCNTCGVSFKTQSNLYKHKRTQAHARLSSECEQSSVGSQDSLYSSGDAGTSSLSLDAISADSGNQEMEVSAPLPQASSSFNSVLPTATAVVGSETGWALHHAALVGLILAPGSDCKIPLGHDAKSEGRNVHEKTKEEDKDERTESIKPSLTPNRHLPLQRQEATMFSKQWEGSMTSGKSQSHDSTDSGFSESSEQPWTSSPGSVLPDHSVESLTESSLELQSQPSTTNISTEPGPTPSENKASVSEQEQKKLEERISKLISENDALVDDKHLENVRPRKTMLSKQGSIDLPMPYTYKDSFHFEIKTTKPSNAVLGWQKIGRGGRAALYNSVPTQCSTTLEHAPMKRSSSLPFSVGIQHSERSSNTSSHLRDFITLARRGSSGHIYPAGFGTKSMDQQVSNHRPLVRQAAMDCNPATEGLAMTTPLEEVCPNNLSSDGDSVDICGEPSGQKYRRKKTQKFAYNKWYMYGGGTFKKLYSTDKTEDNSVLKARKSVTGIEYEGVQGSQRRGSAVHKELVTSAGSTKESSTTVCHPSSLPAYLPTVASVNAHHSGGHLNSFCASLKTTLGEKLPMTTHQPTTGPANTQNELSYQSSESAGDSVMHGGNHTDSVYPIQHCANYNPSETKKQKTDNSLCSSGRQVDPSASKTLTQPVSGGKSCPAPSVTKTNRTYVNTSSSSNNSTTAKTSFLPKYQLKIPNSSDLDSAQTVNKPTGVITHNTICTLSSYQSSWTNVTAMKDTSFSKQKCMGLVALPLSHKYCIASRSDSTQSQSATPVTTAIQYQPVMSFTRQSHIAIPTPAAVQRQPATNKASVESLSVITSTALLQDRDAKPPITFLQNTPVVASARNLSPTCTSLTSSDKSLIVAPCTVSTERQCLTPSTTSLSVNASLTEEVKTATMPCQIIQYNDIEQSAAQNVFHVRTADLQICLQIISDEQLALIEPQIDLQGSTRESEFSSHGGETRTNSKSNSHEQQSHFPRAKDNTNTGIGREISECQEPMELNIKTLLPGCFPQTQQNITFTGHSNVRQTNKPSFMEFTPSTNTGQMSHCWQVSSTSPNPSINPGTHTRMLPPKPKNKESVVSAALSSFKGVKTERKQTQEEEHAISICVLSESCPQPKMLISQMGHISEALSGHHKLCQATLTSFSSSASAKNSTLQKYVSQHESLNERTTCNVDKMITRHKSLESEDPTTRGMHGESDVPQQSCSGQRSNVESSVALPRKEPSSPDKQACELSCEPGLKEILVYGGFLESEPGNSEVISSHKMSSKRSAVEGIQIEAPDVQVPLLYQAQRESEDITPANHRDTQPIQFTSVPCYVKEGIPKHDVLFANQCLTTGVVSRSESSLQGQKETSSPNRPPWQLHSPATEARESHGAREPDNLATEPKESHGAGEPDNLTTEPRDSHGAGEPDNLAKKHKESHGVGVPDNLAKEHKESHGVGEPDDPGTEHKESQDSREPENQLTKKQQMRGIMTKKDGGQISLKSDKVLEQGEVMQKGGGQCTPQTDVLGAERHDVQDKADSHQNSAKSHQPLSQTDAGKCFNPIQLSQQRTITPSNMNSPGICNTSIPKTSQPENKSNGGQFHQHPSLCDTKWLQANQPSHMIQNQHGQSETCHTETTQQCYVKETSAIGCFSNSLSTSVMQQTPNPSSVCKAHVSAVLGEMIIYTHQSGSDAMKTPIQPSNTGTSAHTQPGDRHDKWDLTAPIYTTLTNVPVRQDGSSKYISLSSTGQSHHSPLPDCLLSGGRAVQSSLEDPEDTSSSDDEGKLIIEL